VVIQLSVQYGTALPPLADRVRDVATRVITDRLGPQETTVAGQ
jgi:hypothetical protein